MFKEGLILRYSPSDLTVFLDGEFGSWMDRWALERRPQRGRSSDAARKVEAALRLDAPHAGGAACRRDDEDEHRSILARKGLEHEQRFLGRLASDGHAICDLVEVKDDSGFARTHEAMRAGAQVIYQGQLRSGRWAGFADFLWKQPGASRLGEHHYEVWDTKLARSPKPYFLVQLCAYAEMLEHVQGVRPREVEVVLGDGSRHRFVTDRFFYYYRELKRTFEAYHAAFDPSAPPPPGDPAGFGRWSTYAQDVLERSDDLSCVARMTRNQACRLREAGVTTMAELAAAKVGHVTGIAPETLDRLKRQASLQLRSRGKPRPLFELVKPEPEDPHRGLALLPKPSPGDAFFDMEGYPLCDGGLEYLFGASYVDGGELKYVDWWAHDPIGERRAFEGFIDWAYARWRADPAMHVYHYAGYEVTAVRRLMGRYATREREVDELLRNEVFVDLYAVVRQGLLAGTSSYSLKEIEKLYLDGPRAGGVTTAGGSVAAYQRWLDLQDGTCCKTSKVLAEIRDYNRVDCDSTLQLRDWLLARRAEAGIAFAGGGAAEPTPADDDGGSKRAERPGTQLANELLRQVAEGSVGDSERRRVQELLAWLLEFHWREAKPVFWRKFDRAAMTEPELVDDLDCLGGLRRTAKPREAVKKSWSYEYRFDPDQDTKLHAESKCFFAHDLLARCELLELDLERGLASIKLGPKAAFPPDCLSLIPDEYVSADAIAAAVHRYAASWAAGTVASQAVDDLLHRRRPRIRGHVDGAPLIPATAPSTTAAVVDLATRMDGTVLCIQGPPGTGKTFNAAAVVVRLVAQGKSVGITASSHKAVLNAMGAVHRAAVDQRVKVRLVKVGGDSEDPLIEDGTIERTESGDAAAFVAPGVVLGGTAWVFSRDELVDRLDYLVIDEAGQFSLANVVATGQSARNIILVGDQMQLAQPIQGSHPGESGRSALEYLLKGRATVPPELGVLLDTTWRMHPHICRFISDAVYDGRLKSHPATAAQEVRCQPKQAKAFKRTSGVVFVEVPHQFNSQCSDEEADAIEGIIDTLLGRCVVGRDGKTHALSLEDVLIVAPYNMQVRKLQARLGPAARIGSVDRFQGQEAAVVIVSMCASGAEDAPRGLEFILNKNRLNVAVSRAKCLAIVVGCRGLMAARCTSIEQMEMANLYCWLAAHAETPYIGTPSTEAR